MEGMGTSPAHWPAQSHGCSLAYRVGKKRGCLNSGLGSPELNLGSDGLPQLCYQVLCVR